MTSDIARKHVENYRKGIEKDLLKPEVADFLEGIYKLVDSIEITDWMAQDTRIIDGEPARKYWSRPEEKFARLWAASIKKL